MASENKDNREHLHHRFRRLKKLLRPLPRRATVHRYPVLKWFGERMRKRSYLWSFRDTHAIPAIYVGCIIACMPIVGIQIAVVALLALCFRFNLMLAVAAQFISNPATLWIYVVTYNIGNFVIGLGAGPLSSEILDSMEEEVKVGLVRGTFQAIPAFILGGTLLGLALGFIFSTLYRIFLRQLTSHSFQLWTPRAISLGLKRNKTVDPKPEEPDKPD